MEKNKIKKVAKVLLPLIIIIGVGVVIYNNYSDKTPVFIGTAESLIYPYSSEVSGKIIDMPIDLGQNVEKGQLLMSLDNTDQGFALKQLEISLEKAKILLSDSKLQSGGTASNEYSLAAANYNSAQASASQAAKDYSDTLTLFESEAVSEKELEKTKLAKESTEYAVSAAKAKLDLVASSSGTNTQALNVAQLEIQVEQAKTNLSKYSITANHDGVIVSKSYSPGDVANPGQTIVEIGSLKEKYLTFYLPEKFRSNISYDDEVKFIYDNKTYTGKVTYIDIKKQYTPVDLQTSASKNKKSFKVKLYIGEECPINPGEEADVFIMQ